MESEDWEVVSGWLTEWAVSDSRRRDDLRASFEQHHPELAREALWLATVYEQLDGFLETPAIVLEAPAIANDDILTAGTVVGRYRVGALLARGGTGDVYGATDTQLHRPVALKVLAQSRTADLRRVERFMLEARVTASLNHPHIVRLHDVGQSDGHVYLVAELLEGETLRARIERGRLPVDEARRIAREVAEGLAAAHAAGLVHRDLKPDNVFLTREGVAKILDFGIAKLVAEPDERSNWLTMTGVILGTAGYLAPEQILGGDVDPRADLFALGVLLVEMLTGERAFHRPHLVDTLHAILHDPPAGILEARDDVPPGLADLAMHLLEKAPEARPSSAREVIVALEQATPASLRPLTRGQRTSRWPGSGGRRVAAAALVSLASAGTLYTVWPAAPGRSAVEPVAVVVMDEQAREMVRLGRAAARRITPEDLQVAAKYFEQAIAIEPSFAEAWAGLASAYKRMPVTGGAAPQTAFERARAAAERALELDPTNVEAISSLGTVALWYDWDYKRAETLLQRALALDARHADSHLFLAMLYDVLGQFDEAVAAVRRAQDVDPQWAQLRALEGYFLLSARRYDEAIRYLDVVIQDVDPAMWTTQMYRAHALLLLGRTEDAIRAYERVLDVTSHPQPVSMYAVALSRAGRRTEAEVQLARVPSTYPFGRAVALHALGRDREAIEALNAAVDARHQAVTTLGVSVEFTGIRDQPAFRDILRRVNLLEVADRLAN